MGLSGAGCRQIASYGSAVVRDGGSSEAGQVDGDGADRGRMDLNPGDFGPPLAARWAVATRPGQDLEIASVAYDDKGTAWVAGSFAGRADFAGQLLQAQGRRDAFIARLATVNGELQATVVNFGAFAAELRLTRFAVASSKSIAVSGTVRGQGSFFATPFDQPTETAFVLLLDATNWPTVKSGGLLFCTTAGPPAQISGLALDDKGGVYVAGAIDGPASFVDHVAGQRAFVAAYDAPASGALARRWSFVFGNDNPSAPAQASATGLAVGPTYLYVVGSFAGSALLTRPDGENDIFSAVGLRAGYVARLPRVQPTSWELVVLGSGSTVGNEVRPLAVAYDGQAQVVHVAGQRRGPLEVPGAPALPAGADVFVLAMTEGGPYFSLEGNWLQATARQQLDRLGLASDAKGHVSLAARLEPASLGIASSQDVIRVDLRYAAGSYQQNGHLQLLGGGQARPSSIALSSTGAVLLAGSVVGQASLANATQDGSETSAFLALDDDVDAGLPVDRAHFVRPDANVQVHCGASDVQGNVYLGGRFSGLVDFDRQQNTSASRRDARAGDSAFVASYDDTGAFRWVRTLDSTDSAQVKALVSDGSGGLFAAGTYLGTLELDSGEKAPDSPSTDLFVLRLAEADGTARWLDRYDGPVSAGGPTHDDVTTALYADGQLILVGSHTQGGPSDIAIVRFQPSTTALGSGVASSGVGGAGEDRATTAALLADGSLVVGGYVSSDATQSVNLGRGPQFGSGGRDAFLARYDKTGTATWATLYGSLGDQAIVDLAAGSGDRLAVAGTYSGQLTLGKRVLPKRSNQTQGFVGLFSSGTGESRWAVPATSAGAPVEELRVAFDAQGDVRLAVRFTSALEIGSAKPIPVLEENIWLGALARNDGSQLAQGQVLRAPALSLRDLWFTNGALLVAGTFSTKLTLPDLAALDRDASSHGFIVAFGP